MIELYITGMLFSLLLGLAVLFFRTSWTQVIIYPLLIVLAYISLAEMPGVGKPMAWEWRQFDHAEVLFWEIKEDEGMYLLLRIEGEPLPRYYVRPWDDGEGKQLTNAARYARDRLKEGENYELILNNGGNFDNTPTFHASPIDPPPEKTPLVILEERD